jgi:hypothetical protein
MTDLSLIINGLVLGCGVAVGFSLALLRELWKRRESARKYNPYEVK